MSWRVIVYILLALFVVFVVLPKLAELIHRYLSSPTPPDSSDAKPKDKKGKH